MFTKIKYFITIAILMFSINSNSDEFFDYYHDINQKAITYDDWSKCVISNFKNELGEFLYITSVEGFILYMRKKSFQEVIKFLTKTTLGTTIAWLDTAYIVGKLTYVAGNCAYLEWK